MRKRILLTGVTGFLGSHLAKELLVAGYDVVALKRKSSSLHRVQSIASEIKFFDIDGLNFEDLFRRCGKIDTIIHTATCYGRNNESVSDIFLANTEFPLRLLDVGSRFGVKIFLNADTILYKYLNLYSLSKNQLLQWGKFFSINRKIYFANVRLEHFYGSDDEATKFSTYIINSCLDNVPVLKLTKGEQKRDFIYIDDVVSAFMMLLKTTEKSDNYFVEFDVGSGKSISIRDFVETVHRLTASKTILDFGAIPYRDGEVMHSEANITGLTALGWRCRYDVEAGLMKTLKKERKKL